MRSATVSTTSRPCGPRDSIGTIEPIEEGFVAPGGVHSGLQQRAVVWLSGDGQRWTPVDVPADRILAATDVVPSPTSVVVALTSLSGPAVAVLENANDLLR